MKTRFPVFFTWLALAALGDWLITRTLARAAIFMPKSGVMLKLFSTITASGQLATSLTGVLACLGLGWIAWHHIHVQRNLILVISCSGLLLVNFMGLFIPPAGWWNVSFHILMFTGIIALTWQGWKSVNDLKIKTAIYVVALTLFIGNLYQSLNSIYILIKLSSPPSLSRVVFNTEEVLVIVSVVALWHAFGQGAPKRTWFLAMLPAILFIIPRLTVPAMTGVMAIWSTGLTLYLPWLFYVGAIWLASLTVINSSQKGDMAGFAVLLLAAEGLAPQMSIQGFLGLIALWILVHSKGDLLQNVVPSTPRHQANTQVEVPQLDGIQSP